MPCNKKNYYSELCLTVDTLMEVQVVAYLSTPTAFVFPKRKQKK